MQELQAPIFEEKIVDYILEMAKVTERTVTIEELMADPDGEGAGEPKAKTKKAKPKESQGQGASKR